MRMRPQEVREESQGTTANRKGGISMALENIEKMPQSSFDEIVEKYVEMNIAHPVATCQGRIHHFFLVCPVFHALSRGE